MGPLDLIRHPLIFSGITVPDFIRWYFWHQPRAILRTYFDYLRAFVEIFSFVFLLRTLFSPWKQITDSYPNTGLNISKISQVLVLNVLSRSIGLLFRMITLLIGLMSVTLLTTIFGAFYLLWLGFPLVVWAGLGYIVSPLFT
ncbi:hypothetical protein H6770_04955 [Candidatus Peribacteria bacterium]|nr:hypothetical protein [Candidatus Peribacteria bacterium]